MMVGHRAVVRDDRQHLDVVDRVERRCRYRLKEGNMCYQISKRDISVFNYYLIFLVVYIYLNICCGIRRSNVVLLRRDSDHVKQG